MENLKTVIDTLQKESQNLHVLLKDLRKDMRKELKKEHNKKTYEQRVATKIPCEYCGKAVDRYYYAEHCKSKRHLRFVKDFEKNGEKKYEYIGSKKCVQKS